MAQLAEPEAPISRRQLWLEFVALFIGAPLLIALCMPGHLLFPALAVFSLAGLLLLWRTGGFDWRSLIRGWGRVRWHLVLLFGLSVGLIGWAVMELSFPDYRLNTSPQRLWFLTRIWMLYPLLSALPQELIFRTLFFHRYGALFASRGQAILTNAAIFSFAHLMYWSSIVTVMTFAGGLIFAHAYLRRGFSSAWLLHAIAGNMLFSVGMGAYFYSGNVVRPF